MTRWRWVAALLAALAGGCASLTPGADAAPTAGSSAAAPAASPAASSPAAPASAAAAGVAMRVEIDAPAELKALLERHLDLVRLGQLVTREDVDDSEWSRLIDATPAQVRELLRAEGYFAPEIDLQRAPAAQAGQPDEIRLNVRPGPRARIGRVTLEAEGELERGASAGDPYAVATLEQWRKSWELPSGSDFRNAAWSDAKAAALARLRAAGYGNAAWSGTGAEVDPQSNEVRLFVVVDSGPLYRWGQLQIEGLARHDDARVAYLVNAQRGAPVTETLLLDFQDRLQKSGLFDNISVTLDPDPAKAAQATIVAKLREAPLQTYTLGIGFSANTGARASVEHLYRRVFGYAASSHNKVELGQLRQAWDGEISSHVGQGLYRNLIGGAVEWLKSDDDEVLSQRLRLGRAQDTQRVERLWYAEAERSRRVTNAGERTTAQALSANFHGGWRDLDNIVSPTDGQTLQLQLGLGGSRGTDATSGLYGRVYGRLTVYRPLGRTWYGQARIELGRVFLGDRMVVPESHKWRAGGDESVRGYSYRSLGPQVDGVVGSGTLIFTTSLELARPISADLPSVWGAVFIDAGNAADSVGNLKPAIGLGVGVRWRSPVGPLRVDWAWGQEVRKSRLHFSVGIAF